MKIACTTLACPDWSLQTVLERFRRYGYDAVDFRGLGEELEIWRLPAFSTGLGATAERVGGAGLAVSCFSSGARMFSADAAGRKKSVAEVAEYARLCGVFACPMVRVFGGRLEGTPPRRAIETAAATLRDMSDAAGEGVTVAVETHDDWVASAPLAEAVARADRPNVGVLWDLHHPYRMGNEAPRQTCDNIGARTVAVHVKDSRLLPGGKWQPCMPGEGDVPLAEMVALLAAGGYDGYLTLEWEKRWHPEIAGPDVALPAYAEFMRKLG